MHDEYEITPREIDLLHKYAAAVETRSERTLYATICLMVLAVLAILNSDAPIAILLSIGCAIAIYCMVVDDKERRAIRRWLQEIPEELDDDE